MGCDFARPNLQKPSPIGITIPGWGDFVRVDIGGGRGTFTHERGDCWIGRVDRERRLPKLGLLKRSDGYTGHVQFVNGR
jgi:hypothetical protein